MAFRNSVDASEVMSHSLRGKCPSVAVATFQGSRTEPIGFTEDHFGNFDIKLHLQSMLLFEIQDIHQLLRIHLKQS